MCGLKERCINNLSPLSVSLCHRLSTLLSPISLSLSDLVCWSDLHHLFSLILSPCRGWSGSAVCPSAAKGVRGGVEGVAAVAVAVVVVIVCCSPWPSWWWWPWLRTRQRLKSSELVAAPQKKCQSWTLQWSLDAHATSPTGTSGRCGARRTLLTSMWSHCWSMRLTQKASSLTCVTWCPGPRSTVWCLGMAPTRRPSPRFWILFPRRRLYPSSASMGGRPWSWLIRYGGVNRQSWVDWMMKECLSPCMLLMNGWACTKSEWVNGLIELWLMDCFGLEWFAKSSGFATLQLALLNQENQAHTHLSAYTLLAAVDSL